MAHVTVFFVVAALCILGNADAKRLIVTPTEQKTSHFPDSDIEYKIASNDRFFTDVRNYRHNSTDYEQVDFWKNRDNLVTLIPDKTGKNSKVDAHFTEDDQTRNLPVDYNVYRIVMQSQKVSAEDFHPVYDWKSANDIGIFGDVDVSVYSIIMFRRADLFNTTNLKTFSVSVDFLGCKLIDPKPLFDHVQSLQTVKFFGKVTNMSSNEEFRERLEKELGGDFDVKATDFNDIITVSRKTSVFAGAKEGFSKWFGRKQN